MNITHRLLMQLPRDPIDLGRLSFWAKPRMPDGILIVGFIVFAVGFMSMPMALARKVPFDYVLGGLIGLSFFLTYTIMARRNAMRLQPLDTSESAPAKVLELRSNPDVEAYRLAVVRSGRPFMLADFDNMQAIWDEEIRAKAEANARQETRVAMAKITSAEPSSGCM